jgi:drug/metabolite transporter (DMT)-like permease
MIHPRPALGLGMIATAALFFAVNGTVAKVILQSGIEPGDLTTFRALGGCLGLLVIGAMLRPGIRRFRVTRRELPMLAIYSVAGFFLVPMLYFVAISRLPIGIGLLFEFTAPLFVALWARFVQGQPVRARLWVGLGLSLVGLACVAEVWGELRLDGIGVIAGFVAAVLLAFFFLAGARTVARRDSISITGWGFGISAFAGLATSAVTRVPPDWSALTTTTAGGTPIWPLSIYLVVLGTIVPYTLIMGSLRHLSPTSVGILSMVEPVLAGAIAWVVLDEALNAAQLGGGLLLLFGVGLAETARVAVGQNGPHASSEHDPANTAASQRDSSPAAA